MQPLSLVWLTGFFWLGLLAPSLEASLLIALLVTGGVAGYCSKLYRVIPPSVCLVGLALGLGLSCLDLSGPSGQVAPTFRPWQVGQARIRVLSADPIRARGSEHAANAGSSESRNGLRIIGAIEQISDSWHQDLPELAGRRLLLLLPPGESVDHRLAALRWEITGKFKVSSSGTLRFKELQATPLVSRAVTDTLRLYLIRTSMTWRLYLKQLAKESSRGSRSLKDPSKKNATQPLPRASTGMGQSLMLSMLGSEKSSPRVDYILNRLGLNHLTAISGLHFALVSSVALFLLYPLSMPIRLLGVAFFSSLFLLLSGPGPSSLRAWMMTMIAIGCLLTGRRYGAMQSLALSAIIWLIIYPEWAIQPGFILSVYCTAILIAMSPLLQEKKGGGPVRLIQSWIILQGAFFLFLAPLQLYWFHSLGWLSIIANIAIAPLLAGCFCLALMGAFSGLLSPLLGQWLFHLASSWSELLLYYLSGLPHRLDQTWKGEISPLQLTLSITLALTGWLKLLYLEKEENTQGGDESS